MHDEYEQGGTYKADRAFVVEVIKHPREDGIYGVEVRTDSETYDMVYDTGDLTAFGDASGKQERLNLMVCNTLGKPAGDHYFESSGGGILFIY